MKIPPLPVQAQQLLCHRIDQKVKPESFAALDSKEWDSWLVPFEDCAEINKWNPARRAQFLAVRIWGAALLQLQSIPATVRADCNDLKAALWLKFVSQGRVLSLASRKRREALGSVKFFMEVGQKSVPEAAKELQDSLAKDQFIDALVDREIRLKLRESGGKMLDEVVSHALQIEAMCEAELRCGKGWSVRLLQEPPP